MNRFKTLRRQTGLSQVKFSQRYHIPLGTLRDWEQMRKQPPEYVFHMLEQIVDIPWRRNMPSKLNSAISVGKRQLVDSIWKSAGIEGLGTTFPNTERILENIPTEISRDEVLFIVNMKRAWEFLFDNIDYPVTMAYLSELNKICMTDILFDAGKIRTYPVTIGGTKWVPELPDYEAIQRNVKAIADNPDKLESALDMFCYVARTQMFTDGNKRVSQLICNKILMDHDIGILSIPYEKIDDFKQKLVSFYESGDPSKLKTFFRETSLLLNPTYVENIEEAACNYQFPGLIEESYDMKDTSPKM